MVLNLVFMLNTPSLWYQIILIVSERRDPSTGQVRNANSQNNWQIHIRSKLSFQITTDMQCQSYVCLPMISLRALQWGSQVAVTLLMKLNNNADLVIGTDYSLNSTKITWSSNIQVSVVGHALCVWLQSLVPRDKFQWTTRVALENIQSCNDTVSVYPQHPNSSNLAPSTAPVLLKYYRSPCWNNVSECEGAPYSEDQHVYMYWGGEIVQHPKTSADQHIPEHQNATSEPAKRIIKCIGFTISWWLILTHDQYSMAGDVWKLAIETYNTH